MEDPIEVLVETDMSAHQYMPELAEHCIAWFLEQLQIKGASITLRFACQDAMEELNFVYRNKKSSTDVLSFPQFDSLSEIQQLVSESVPVHLGDLVVSPSDVLENCREFDVPAFEELPRLIIHGMLHCIGETHASYRPDDPMLQRQEALLKQFLDARRVIQK